ncbi:hypothetical protein [Actinoplanes sp. NPDC049681]|uniref:hypothetical protein n=1 Tax=Actinoplanes sp. NPDC049681 TaxID=3363905 RepID=UPI0037A06457
MDLGGATLAVGGAIGMALALFGVKMLVSGRAPASTLRNFPAVRDAALYHLLFGAALLLMVLGQALLAGTGATVTSGVAIVLVAVALIRYRPRRGRPREDT